MGCADPPSISVLELTKNEVDGGSLSRTDSVDVGENAGDADGVLRRGCSPASCWLAPPPPPPPPPTPPPPPPAASKPMVSPKPNRSSPPSAALPPPPPLLHGNADARTKGWVAPSKTVLPKVLAAALLVKNGFFLRNDHFLFLRFSASSDFNRSFSVSRLSLKARRLATLCMVATFNVRRL